MNFLHSACFLSKPSSGIIQQMNMEYESAKSLNLKWDVLLFLPKGYNIASPIIVESKYIDSAKLSSIWYKIYAWFALKVEYYLYLSKKDYDFILTRYSVHDLWQLIFLIFSKKKIFLVHHTKEEDELKMNTSLLGRLRYYAEKVIGKWCIGVAYGIVAVTQEIKIHQLSRKNKQKAFTFPNGIFMGEQELCVGNKFECEKYKLLFVASDFQKWHGLDLLIKSLKSSVRNDFELHLVGKVYNEEYELTGQDSRVIFHGVQSAKYIADLSSSVHIALSSFALFRKNMNEACTLKVREYLSFGIPVYSGHKDIFPDNFPYYQIGEPDIDNIIAYAEKMKQVDKKLIIEQSKQYIDKRYLLAKLYKELTE